MRLLKAKDVLRVIKGEDIEFRLNPYDIQVKEPVVIDGVRSIYSLEFPRIKFNSIVIRNCEFIGSLKFKHLIGDNFSFENSEVGKLGMYNSTINRVSVKDNKKIGELNFDRTSINDLSIVQNRSFEKFHLGCYNNVLRATFSHNGFLNSGMTESSVYICPEQFGEIDIKKLNASRVEIGSFGEHSRLSIDGVVTDEFKIKNCDYSKSQVSLKNIKPMGEHKSQLTIEDSVLDETVLQESEVKKFNDLSIENSRVGTLRNVTAELKTLQKARFWKRNISSLFLW